MCFFLVSLFLPLLDQIIVLSMIFSFIYFNKSLGSELVSPWGIAQRLLKSKPNLEDPIVNDDLHERVRHLERLNRFYEGYAINVPTPVPNRVGTQQNS